MDRTLFHASDLHFGRCLPDRLTAFAAAVAAEQPDMVVLTGDLTDAGKRSEYAALNAYLRTLEAPLLLVPGNHDAPVYAPFARLLRPFARLAALPGRRESARLGADVEVAGLRTAEAAQLRLDWSLGAAPRDRVRKALAALDAAGAARWRLVACHHALIDPPCAGTRAHTRQGAHAHAMLENAGVDLLLCGHGHHSFVGALTTQGRLWTSLAPTLASPRTRGGAQGFHRVALHASHAEIALQEWDGSTFAPREATQIKKQGTP